MEKEYICECGKVFASSQEYGGHCTHCSEHLKNRGLFDKSYHNPLVKEKIKIQNISDKTKQWVSEKHTCEKCGRVMIEKFGAGRFCSRSCANGKQHKKETKQKIRNSLLERANRASENGFGIKEKNEFQYWDDPQYCIVCGRELEYSKKNNLTCSKECTKILQSSIMKEKYKNGSIHQSSSKRYRYGTYKGTHCDSSWELAFVMYMIDNNIAFIRNTKEWFTYTYKGKEHLFYPDFIVDGEYYEIKNYKSELTDTKIREFPKNKKLHVLYYSDMKKYLQYAKETYGENFTSLYDRNYPSWMDNT